MHIRLKMRVVFVNWADFRAGALFGGGVNGYLQSLAIELKARGFDVISLTGGWTYIANGRGCGPCRVRRLDDFEGVARFEVVNSPVVAPGIFQAREPALEVVAPELDEVFNDFIDMCAPDVVHFHNIEGFSASCITTLSSKPRRLRPAVVFSLHNYHTICPQVYLMRGGRIPCTNFEDGALCMKCMDWESRDSEIAVRSGIQIRGSRASASPQATLSVTCSDGSKVSESNQPLANDPEIEGPVLDARNLHAFRRKAMVQMLSSCDAVLAVSTFVERKFISMGVDPGKLKRMPIGTALAGSVPKKRRTAQVESGMPLRLAFIGYHNYYKGLHVLVDSLMDVRPDLRKSLAFDVFAKDLGEMEGRLRSMQSDFADVRVLGEYKREELPQLLEGVDVGVVPSVWWDNGPQTVMEFLACGVPVLGAELGGIPDLVKHGENGWLFRGNDRSALTKQLERLAQHPQDVERATAGIAPMRSIAEHATEMLVLYESLRHGIGVSGDDSATAR